jgi:hypothetical protein
MERWRGDGASTRSVGKDKYLTAIMCAMILPGKEREKDRVWEIRIKRGGERETKKRMQPSTAK